jgi:hypothetical protein
MTGWNDEIRNEGISILYIGAAFGMMREIVSKRMMVVESCEA